MKITMTEIGALIVAAGLVLAISVQAYSETATQYENALGTVIAPIGITKTTDFTFGRIVAGSSGGTVVLSTGSGRTATGGTGLVNRGATPAAAVFLVTGERDYNFSISFSSGVTLTDTAGIYSMTVDNYVAKVGSGSDQTSNYTGILTSSPVTLIVGATLHVGTSSNNPAGTYSTSNSGGAALSVTVSYN